MSSVNIADDVYYLSDQLNSTLHSTAVKTEASPSPDLLPASASFQQYQFSFHSPPLSSQTSSRRPSNTPSILPYQPAFRFGGNHSSSSLATMPENRPWPASSSSSHQDIAPGATSGDKFDLGLEHAMSFSDEYQDVNDLVDATNGMNDISRGESASVAGERVIRRRSSKACDQCRKSKCKCERSSPNEPCRSCIMLGTPCTFLGPSRKRGPPKGYIDAIEARLHQTEALLGIMLASRDSRADSLIRDISRDPFAKEIINRVDNSPYGVKGRSGRSESERASSSGNKSRYTAISSAEASPSKSGNIKLELTHPSNEWQDRVTAMLRSAATNENPAAHPDSTSASDPGCSTRSNEKPAMLTTNSNDRSFYNPDAEANSSDRSPSPSRRQRRRVDGNGNGDGDGRNAYQEQGSNYPSSASAPVSCVSTPLIPTSKPPRALSNSSSPTPSLTQPPGRGPLSPGSMGLGRYDVSGQVSSPSDGYSSTSDEEDLPDAIGQLSLNEDEQVRYHGKASGLYLLGLKDRVDQRNAGGIWRFPKARVWPPLPSNPSSSQEDEEGLGPRLPPQEIQEHLLEIYFNHVHPFLPIIHKSSFYDAFHGTRSSDSDSTSYNTSLFSNRRPRRGSTLLLFAMFAIAARYSDSPSNTPRPSSDGSSATPMWDAGDDYLEQAKALLDRSYSSSRPSTCQALLLMGYREVGIGAMAQAWTYVGMAIRMAQDLGMHRSADGWARVGLGGRLFGEPELQERRRIWYACVVMDKYVSAYIGRPLMIFERDFDTLLPSIEDPEDMEEWKPHTPTSDEPRVPSRIISCFNAAAVLSGILSMIIQAIYAVRPVSSRHGESIYLEGALDKWFYELPEHLRHDPVSLKTQKTPLPHVLTLHMQYWCAVLLLHRPFIRNIAASVKNKNPEPSDEPDAHVIAEKSYELCASAANHITSIASLYQEKHPLDKCSSFLCYYVFSASVMHILSLSTFPDDPQARIGLKKCMSLLKEMQTTWPSAARALELLSGSKVNFEDSELIAAGSTANLVERRKRPLDRVSHHQEAELQYPVETPNNKYDAPVQSARHDENRGTDNDHAGYTSSDVVELHPVNTNTSPTTPYYSNSPFQRWPENQFDDLPFTGTLSTSVLPQSYSTGLVDERTSTMGHRHSSSITHHGSVDHRFPPQYWNDYSAYSQFGNTYDGIPDQQISNNHLQHATSPQVFLSAPYNVYNNPVRGE